jgi:hypothetical protein
MSVHTRNEDRGELTISRDGTKESERSMLEMTTCCRRIGEVDEEDRVDIFWSGCLFEGGAVGVDMEERVSGRKRTKRCLHYWLYIRRIQDDKSVNGHRSQANCPSRGSQTQRVRADNLSRLMVQLISYKLTTPCMLHHLNRVLEQVKKTKGCPPAKWFFQACEMHLILNSATYKEWSIYKKLIGQ